MRVRQAEGPKIESPNGENDSTRTSPRDQPNREKEIVIGVKWLALRGLFKVIAISFDPFEPHVCIK